MCFLLAPPPPREIRTEISIQKDSDQHAFQVHLSWLPPQNTSEENPILKYLVEISSFNINNPTAVHKMNLNELNNTLFSNMSPLLRNTLAENYTVPGVSKYFLNEILSFESVSTSLVIKGHFCFEQKLLRFIKLNCFWATYMVQYINNINNIYFSVNLIFCFILTLYFSILCLPVECFWFLT